MIKEFSFGFNELSIDLAEIASILGYANEALPAPFDEYLAETLHEASKLTDIKAKFRVIDQVVFDQTHKKINAEGQHFKIGKTVFRELKGCTSLAFFVCTAGKTISDKAVDLMKGEEPVLGYMYDVVGSAIAEAATDKMQHELSIWAKEQGLSITNRYSPGYCQWAVNDQHALFSLLGGQPCGVNLTPSALMFPIKSVSGIIGIGTDAKFNNYQCSLCTSANCTYRNIKANT